MKKLFYALILIGFVGCGAKETVLPDNIKVYQIYEYDGKYGMIEQPPFDGLKGEVKQVVNHIENGGTETYTFHRNGLIDEISTDVFDAESKQNKIDKIKYNYKYKDDILYRTILKNGSKIHEDKTYYRNGLPMLRESNGGTENWNHDNEGRLTSYSRNGKVIFEKKYMLNSAYEGKWIEEYHYMDKPYLRSITNYNDANQITSIDNYTFNDPDESDNPLINPWTYTYTEEYYYNRDGSYSTDYVAFDKFGNLEGTRECAIEYEYDEHNNWTKRITDYWHSEYHTEEYRDITYWEDLINEFVVEEEIIPIVVEEEIIPIVVEEEIIPITSIEQVKEEAIPYQLVDVKPSFQGGDINHFTNWVNSRLVYPEIAKANGVQGRVTLQFTVEKDGSVTKVRVVRGVDPSLDEEAVRVVSMSPKWEPGKHEGHVVPVTYTFPIIFQLY